MNNKSLQKYDDSIFGKIRKFFHELLSKPKDETTPEINENKVEQGASNIKQEVAKKPQNTIEQMRTENAKAQKEEEIIEMVKKNPNLIDNLSSKKLEKLQEIIDAKINSLDAEIAKLKSHA